MNNILLLISALAVTICSFESNYERSIRPGREYTFKYETQVLTGPSVDNKQFAGLKLKANVTLQTKDGVTVFAWIQPSCKILKVNDVVRAYRPSEIFPDSEMEVLQGAEKEQIVRELTKPFKFKMESGRFTDLQCEPSEPYFSVNIKRGLLSLMQLDLVRANEIREESDEERILSRMNIVSPERQPKKSYRTMEADVTGVCESVYTVLPAERNNQWSDEQDQDQFYDSARRERDPQSLKVSKVKNYDNCRVRPIVYTGIWESIFGQITDPSYERRLLNFQSESDYEIRSNTTNYLMQWAKLVSKQHFNTLKAEKGKLLTTTVQQLRLIDVSDARSQIRTARDLEKKSIVMEIPKPQERRRDQEPERRQSRSEVHAKCGVVEELLSELVTKTSPYVKADAAVTTAKLTLMLSELPTSEIQAFVDKYCSPQSQMSSDPSVVTKSEVLLDILPTIARPEVVPTINKLVNDRVISQERASYMISMMTHSTPHTELVDDLLAVAKGESLRNASPLLKRTCLLTAGSIMFKLAARQGREISYVASVDSELNRQAEEVTNMLHRAREVDEKVDVIRCMGNAGLPQFLPVLKEAIKNKDNHPSIRTKAMYALRRMAPVFKSKVLDICMSQHLDYSKPQKLRIAAFTICMESNPSFGVMKMISQNLKKEPSLQVGSYVYSSMKSLSENSIPMFRNLTITAKKALKFAKPIRPGFMYSKEWSTDSYDEDIENGIRHVFKTIATKRSVLPETFILDSQWYNFGIPNSYELGIETEGMQTLFKNFVGPQSVLRELLNGRFSLKEILEPIRNPSPSMLAHIRAMMDKISTTERRLSNFAASSYIKFFNQEMLAFNLDSNYLESVFQFVIERAPEFLSELSQGKNFKILKTLSLVDGSLNVPTPCGMPVSMNVTSVTVLGAEGTIRLTNVPSFWDILSMLGKSRSRDSSSRDSNSGRRYSRYEEDIVESRDERSRRDDDRRNWRQEPTTDSSRHTTTLFLDIKPSLVSDNCISSGVTLGPLKTAAMVKSKIHLRAPSISETKINFNSGRLSTKFNLKPTEEELVRLEIEPVTTFTKTPAHPTTTPYICEQKTIEFPQVLRNTRETYRLPCRYLGLNFDVAAERNEKKVPTPLFTAVWAKKYLSFTATPQRDAPSELELELLYLSPTSGTPTDLINSVLGNNPRNPNNLNDYNRDPKDRDQYQSDDFKDEYNNLSELDNEEESGWNTWWSPFKSDNQESYRRVSPGSKEAHGLNEVRPDSDIPSAFKHQIIAVLKTKGDRCHKKVKAQYTHIHSEDLLKHQDDLQVVYKSCRESDESQEDKFNVKSKLNLDVLKKWMWEKQQPQTANSRDLLNKVELHKGPVGRLSKVADCEIKIGREAPEDCQNCPIPAPITLRAELDYSSSPSYFTKSLYIARNQLAQLPKWAGRDCSIVTKPEENRPNRLVLVSNFITQKGEVQIVLKDPRQTTIVKRLPLMFYQRVDASSSLAELNYHRQRIPILRGSPEKKCKVYDDQCKTFDRQHADLDLPQTDCEVILTKDCSSQSNPAFMVTMKKHSKSEPKKTVKIYLPHRKIKIEPQRGWFSSVVEVEVDDRKISLPSDGKKYTVNEDASNPKDSKKCAEIWKEGEKVVVYAHESGLKVKSDGKDVEVDASPSFHGQVCGVCSNKNGEPRDDLEGPRKEKHSSARSFVTSYTIRDPSCNYEELRQQNQSSSSRPCSTQYRTIRRQHERDGVRETCYSTRPVAKCDGACRREQPHKVQVPMHCVPSDDSRVQNWDQQAREGREVQELKGKQEHWKLEEDTQGKCRPSN